MTAAQRDLLCKAQESLDAARLLQREGFYAFAASRAYYAMFYVAQAFLVGMVFGGLARTGLAIRTVG